MPEQKTVMIIEDEEFLSSLLKSRLEKEGYKVVQAFDGEEALALMKSNSPSLILLDIIMPKLSGFGVLEAISMDPELNGKAPIVILSNLAQESDIEKAQRLGASEFFVKVRVSIDDLIKKVNGILTN
jgi:CheY-like chemotaxis protein